MSGIIIYTFLSPPLHYKYVLFQRGCHCILFVNLTRIIPSENTCFVCCGLRYMIYSTCEWIPVTFATNTNCINFTSLCIFLCAVPCLSAPFLPVTSRVESSLRCSRTYTVPEKVHSISTSTYLELRSGISVAGCISQIHWKTGERKTVKV